MFKRIKQLFSSSAASVPAPEGDDARLLINAYCTVADVPDPAFAHRMKGRRDLRDKALGPHLNGLMHHVAEGCQGRMTRLRYHVIRHFQRVQCHVSLSIAPEQLPEFTAWALAANAIVLAEDGSIRDPQGRVLLYPAQTGDAADAEASGAEAVDAAGVAGKVADAAPEGDPLAVMPYLPQAWERKARSEQVLAGRAIVVPADLPPVVADAELRLRTPEEILRRMLALFVVAIRAESLAGKTPIPVKALRKRFPPAFKGLTEVERDFLAKDAPDEKEVTLFLWRYEAILVLQWAIGLQDKLPFADAICDVSAISSTVIERGTDGLRQQPVARPAVEVLDTLDLHYRLHWASRQARLKKTAVPAGLNDSVLQERHHALNWLVRFEDREWDDVDTPT